MSFSAEFVEVFNISVTLNFRTIALTGLSRCMDHAEFGKYGLVEIFRLVHYSQVTTA